MSKISSSSLGGAIAWKKGHTKSTFPAMLTSQRCDPKLSSVDFALTRQQINTCHSEHDAITRAAVRCTPGYSATGAGLVICSRHGLVKGNGVGDLQKGERYVFPSFWRKRHLTNLTVKILQYGLYYPCCSCADNSASFGDHV
jgi:hypothetical protein